MQQPTLMLCYLGRGLIGERLKRSKKWGRISLCPTVVPTRRLPPVGEAEFPLRCYNQQTVVQTSHF